MFVSTNPKPLDAPNVFPLMPCGPQSRDTVTLGCLAVDFTPSSLTFSWTQGANSLENITQYPSILKNDKYLGISQVEVSRQDWDAKKPFQCVANHLGERTTSPPFTKQDVLFRSPNLTTSFSLDEEKQQASFYCFAKDFSPRTHEIIWQKVGSEKASILDETSVFSEGRNDTNGAKLYSAASLLTVNPTELTSGATFTCVFKGKGVNNTDVLEKANATYKEESSGEVTLTCSVKDFFPEEVFVAWLVDDDVVDSKYKTSTTSPVEKEGSYLVYSQLTLTDDQWKQSGVVYSCAVYHESITNSTRSIVRSIGFSTADKNNLVNLNLNISEKSCVCLCVCVSSTGSLEEDHMANTALTFIFLFIMTLLFTVGTTLSKVNLKEVKLLQSQH
uniref:Ig-like domain-containing protein n=1 Tax=Oryzias latipes TaxID=8090 RepID=A0A3B3ICB3_ORYLA